MSNVYAITTNNLFGLPDEGPWFVAWQNPVHIDDDGYFWTTEETFLEVLNKFPQNNDQPHPFAFQTEKEARALAENHHYLRMRQYSIRQVSIERRSIPNE